MSRGGRNFCAWKRGGRTLLDWFSNLRTKLNIPLMFRKLKRASTVAVSVRADLRHPCVRLQFLWMSSSSTSKSSERPLTSSKVVRLVGSLETRWASVQFRKCFRRWKKRKARYCRRTESLESDSGLAVDSLKQPKLMFGDFMTQSIEWPCPPWLDGLNKLGPLTGLLGNLSLLSYFASKRERGAMVVQAVGVVSTLAVLSQLAIAEAKPFTAFAVVASVVGVGLVLNFLNYNNKLSPEVRRLWGEVVSIGGVTVLPQFMWSTFVPYLPPSIIPGSISGVLAVTIILLARLEKLPPKFRTIMGAVSAWTATLLFMWAPVAQWWTNYIYPNNIKGLSVFTVLLAMIGNSLLFPRALFTRDLMWCTGSGWGALFQGWGFLVSVYIAQVVNDLTFWGVSGALLIWLSTILWKDSKAFDLKSPFTPLIEVLSGTRL